MKSFLVLMVAAALIQSAAAQTNDPSDAEYRKVMTDDDDAQQDVIKWTSTEAKGDTAKIELRMRIRERLDGVRREYEDFLLRHPNNVNGHLAFGSFLNEMHEEDEAVAQWDTARLLAPTNPAPWNNLADYYGHRGPTRKAFEYYEKAIQLDPNQSVYYHNLAMIVYLFRPDAEEYYHLTEQQVFDKALDDYRKAIRLAPNDFILFSDYAMSFYGTRPPRWKDGLEAWTQALKVTHDEEERQGVYVHLARINLKLGNFEAARANLAVITAPQYQGLKQKLTENLNVAIAQHPAPPAN